MDMSRLNGMLDLFQKEFDIINPIKSYDYGFKNRVGLEGELDYFIPTLKNVLVSFKEGCLRNDEYTIKVHSVNEIPEYFGIVSEKGSKIINDQRDLLRYKSRKEVGKLAKNANREVNSSIPDTPRLTRKGEFWIRVDQPFEYDYGKHDFLGSVYSTIYTDKFSNFKIFDEYPVKALSENIDSITVMMPENSNWFSVNRNHSKYEKIRKHKIFKKTIEVKPEHPTSFCLLCDNGYSMRDSDVRALASVFRN